jgi:ribosomal protein S18 acetylase RimI-like enzyme
MVSTIELLDHCLEDVAIQVYDLFQQSYQIEAQLVGAKEFPPLQRSASHIQAASSKFLAQWVGSDLAVVIEFSLGEDHLSIDSLVVHPRHFRRGLASNILRSLLDRVNWQTADVETAAANHPAIALYEKFRFSESKRWKRNNGIEKVQLSCSKAL